MSIRFFDGFRHYSEITHKYDSGTSGGTGEGELHSTGSGVTGGGYIKTGMGVAGNINAIKVLTAKSTWFMGVRFKSNLSNNIKPIILYSAGNPGVYVYVEDGSPAAISVRKGWSQTVLGTTPVAVLQPDVWTYFELKVVIGASGSYELRKDGVTILSASGVDTRNDSSSTTCDAFGFAGYAQIGDNNQSAYWTDLYVADGDGGQDFLGDVKVETIVPTSSGAHTDWTPSAGYGYACVDELPANGDTDYIHSKTEGAIDTYVYGNLATTDGEVVGVQVCPMVRKDDAGTRVYAPMVRVTGTDYVGTSLVAQDAYTVGLGLWATNPYTAAAWSIDDVNNAEFGVKVVTSP